MKGVNFLPPSIRHSEARFYYQVALFGIKSAQDVFQKPMSQHFGDLEGAETDIDDIIVHADTEMKHDCRLNSVLDRCKKINLH